jgi:glutamate/tyrosine decarboxylase-like PLP-dependent enzyme
MERNVAQAQYFAGFVEREPRLELMAPVELDIVCFRFNPGEIDSTTLNDLNRELLIRIHESGVAVPSYTTIGGAYCLRIAISNHRSTFADFDLFTKTVVEFGTELRDELVT